MEKQANEIGNLVREVQNGNKAAFNALYELSLPEIEKVCHSVLKNPQDAEDAVQTTYLTVYRSLSHQGIAEIRDPDKFIPWAKSIANHTSINIFNRNKSKTGKNVPLDSDRDPDRPGLIEQPDSDPDFAPEEQAEALYVRKCLMQSLDALPETRRLCLVLHESGLTVREISGKLAIPEGTVKSHIRYAKKALNQSIRRMEKQEGVELHGMVWIPIGRTLIPDFTLDSKATSGWIAAESKAGPPEPQEDPRPSHHVIPVVRRVIAFLVAAGLIAGIVIIVMHSRKTSDVPVRTTTTSSAASTLGQSTANRPSQTVRSTAVPAPGAAPGRSVQSSTSLPTEAAPSAPASTTRQLNGPVFIE